MIEIEENVSLYMFASGRHTSELGILVMWIFFVLFLGLYSSQGGEEGVGGGGGDRRTGDPPAAPAATRKQPSTRIRIVIARA